MTSHRIIHKSGLTFSLLCWLVIKNFLWECKCGLRERTQSNRHRRHRSLTPARALTPHLVELLEADFLCTTSLLHTPSLTRGSKVGSSDYMVARCPIGSHLVPGPDSKHALFLRRRTVSCRGGHGSVLTPLEAIKVLHLELPKDPCSVFVCYGHLGVIGSVESCIIQGTQQLALLPQISVEPPLALGPTHYWLPDSYLVNGREQHSCMFCVSSPKSRKAHQASSFFILFFYLLKWWW